MSDYATKDDVQEIVNKAVDDLTQIIGNFAQQVDDRFNKVESDIRDLKVSLDRLTNTVDGFVKRLDEQEIENTARDAQFARLLDWAEKVADKTGIPLPSLK